MAEANDLEFEAASGDEELDNYLLGGDQNTYDDPLYGQPPLIIDGQPAAEFGTEPNKKQTSVEDLTNPEPEGEIDLISQLLEAKGIKDGLIKIQEEDGTEVDVPFNELTAQEQFNILNSTDEEINYGLNENETQAVNFLRENNVTLEETIDYFVKQAVAEALKSNQVADSIAEYTDDEVYALDLLTKYKDLTEEEIQIELDKQREHPELFKKKVDTLRNEYLQLEQDEVTQKELAIQQQEEEKFKKVQDDLVAVAREVADIGGIDIEIEDKQEVLQFILNKDVNGLSEFGKILDDPKALFEVAWYAKKGKEAFDVIHKYYRNEIAEASKKGYEKGKLEAKPDSGQKKNSNLRTAVRTNTRTINSHQGTSYPDADVLYTDL